MKALQKIWNNNPLLKISSANSLSVLVKIITGFITNKALAIFVGPTGMGYVGNFRDFYLSLQTIATVGLSNGIIKYVAEFRKDLPQLARVLSTALGMTILAAIACGFFVIFTASYWNSQLFSDTHDFTVVIQISGASIVTYAIYTLVLAIINGYSKYKIYIVSSMLANISGLLITVILVWKYALIGALYALIIIPVVSLIITCFFIYKKRVNLSLFNTKNIDLETISKFKNYILMALVSGLALPLVRILIRDYIEIHEDSAASGYWEAMFRISNFYLLFFTTLMTLYILPKFSNDPSDRTFRQEVGNFYKTLLPLFGLALGILYLLRTYVILILQTEAFLEMEKLFGWQLLGDFFKVASMVIAYRFIAQNMLWPFIITEIFSLLLLYGLTLYLVPLYGFVGAAMAYAIQMFIYLALVLFIFRKPLYKPAN